ncbi:MAG: dTMP kinase [Candidatus Korobacteraceae bacterium]
MTYSTASSVNGRPLLVTFSGLDGSGKSTQIENLRVFLEAQGLRTRVLTFWDNVVVLAPLREGFVHTVLGSERGIGNPGRPVNRRDKNVRAWYLTAMRHILYLLDAASARWVLWRNRGTDVIILDRYLYDQVVNLPLASSFTAGFIRFLTRLAPTPDIAYLLDADPDAARARKPEYPVDFLQKARMSYYRLAAMLRNLTLVPPLPVEPACRAVEGAFLQFAQGAVRTAVAQPELPKPELSA